MTKSKTTRHDLGTGIIQYRDEAGRLHNDHQSAVRCKTGLRIWYKHGKRHRIGGPAIKHPNGDYQWYENGKLHRTDGPAVKTTETKYGWLEDEYMPLYNEVKYYWYRKGHLNKIQKGSTIQYFRNGKLHRTDGPAIEWGQGDCDHNPECTYEWYVNGELHRTDGPAREYEIIHFNKNNKQFEIQHRQDWYVNGELHRTDGPAIDDIYGRQWWVNGELHRTDGPAVERTIDHLLGIIQPYEWWVNGRQLSKTELAFIENGLISLEDYSKKSVDSIL